MRSVVRVTTTGQMGSPTWVHGQPIKCTGLECSHGQMENDMKVNSLMIKEKERVHLHGLMDEFILGNGKMESNMEEALISVKMGKRKLENGSMVEN